MITAIVGKSDVSQALLMQKQLSAGFYDPNANIFYKSPSNNPLKKKSSTKTSKNTSTYYTRAIGSVVKSDDIGKPSDFSSLPAKQVTRKVSTPAASGYNLTDHEKSVYGNRMAPGYKKIDLLGKGGCAIVWLAKHLETGKSVAVKQFPKKVDFSSGKVEALILQRIFQTEIDPKEFPGIKYIAELLDINEDKTDLWLTYELGGMTLTKNLFEVKGEFYKGERVYHCNYQNLYFAMKTNRAVLIDFMTKMLQVFELLAALDIVHADLKPDNILVDFDGKNINNLKLIDFGSAFIYSEATTVSMSTPEYLSPEVLKFIDTRHSAGQEGGKTFFSKMEPWSYDIWSLGAIFLEIITGFPLWLGLKGKIKTKSGKNVVNFGVFGVQGRVNAKIVTKQTNALKNLGSCIKKYDSYGFENDEILMDFMYGLLDKSPRKRISPTEALAHPFIIQELA